jgi:hypothetical protein
VTHDGGTRTRRASESFRDLLPPEVRARIEEQEARGVSIEEQGRIREPTRPRPVAPMIATDDTEGLFGTSEDPQTGNVHYLMPPKERD